MILTPPNSTIRGLLFVLKISGVNYMLSALNFIYKYIGPYMHWMQKNDRA